ncbi:MAG: hypothetical protein JOY56_08520 [Solirubrobacterales bacterium]|nr:hypothetical protein [Solirubrobacterales bacterium]MBV9685087.1 hypothetical protein [Solirubrobacterales bacterium]MBV9809926.1 hypothetical protein [Solirubrobacterales bacterium]
MSSRAAGPGITSSPSMQQSGAVSVQPPRGGEAIEQQVAATLEMVAAITETL